MHRKPDTMTDKEVAEEFARSILAHHGYNYALSITQSACDYLDHPELKESDTENYHGWAEPYTRRCYCSRVGYTDAGRFYANDISEQHINLLREIFKDPTIHNKFKEPYSDKKKEPVFGRCGVCGDSNAHYLSSASMWLCETCFKCMRETWHDRMCQRLSNLYEVKI